MQANYQMRSLSRFQRYMYVFFLLRSCIHLILFSVSWECTYELIHLCTVCAQVHIRTSPQWLCRTHHDWLEHFFYCLTIDERGGDLAWLECLNVNRQLHAIHALCSHANEIKRASMIDWVVAQHSSTIWICQKKCNTNSLHTTCKILRSIETHTRIHPNVEGERERHFRLCNTFRYKLVLEPNAITR